MKKISFVLLLASLSLFAFDLGSVAKSVVSNLNNEPTSTQNTPLTQDTVSSGLKSALKVGVDFAVKELGKDDGYLNNSLTKIPLPENLAKAESLIRRAGGDKMADDLIVSMNTAATKAAPKTAKIFLDAIDNMTLEDAKQILAGGDNAATEYFKMHTSASLKDIITPIIDDTMKENKVATYYDNLNNFYKANAKDLVDNSSVMSVAKNFGVDSYLPESSDKNLDEYVTDQAMDGLFKMIATKEAQIRTNPIAQTTSLLKAVFGK